MTYSIVEQPTPEPPLTPPDMCSDTFDSHSISLAIENNDSQNESNPCEDHSVDMGQEDTVPLLETAI